MSLSIFLCDFKVGNKYRLLKLASQDVLARAKAIAPVPVPKSTIEV
jgi:hypothetical protein